MFIKLRIPVIFLATLLVMVSSRAVLADLAIIVHPDTDTGNVDSYNIRKLFLGERRAFPNGQPAIPLNHAAGSPDRKAFFDLVLNMQESAHKRHWKRKIAVGIANTPAELSSYSAVLESVATTPGSISYIDASVVDDRVKVLLTLRDLDAS